MTADFVELAGESTAHLRRVVDVLASEVRHVGVGAADDSGRAGTILRRAARKARMARRHIALDAEELDQEWTECVLDRRPFPVAAQLARVEQFAQVAATSLDLIASVHTLHRIVVDNGGPVEPTPELDQAEVVYRLVLSQATEAAVRLSRPWQPKDEARFVDTMRADRPKKFYSEDEARSYFRPKQS